MVCCRPCGVFTSYDLAKSKIFQVSGGILVDFDEAAARAADQCRCEGFSSNLENSKTQAYSLTDFKQTGPHQPINGMSRLKISSGTLC